MSAEPAQALREQNNSKKEGFLHATFDWANDDTILKHANPVALEIPEIWEDLIKKRARAISVESTRENFLTKHCNVIYQGLGTELEINFESARCTYDTNMDQYVTKNKSYGKVDMVVALINAVYLFISCSKI